MAIFYRLHVSKIYLSWTFELLGSENTFSTQNPSCGFSPKSTMSWNSKRFCHWGKKMPFRAFFPIWLNHLSNWGNTFCELFSLSRNLIYFGRVLVNPVICGKYWILHVGQMTCKKGFWQEWQQTWQKESTHSFAWCLVVPWQWSQERS